MKSKQTLEVTPDTVERYTQQFVDEKIVADAAASRVKKMRDNLVAYVATNGIEDDSHHMWVDVGDVGKLKRERRVSHTLNEAAARAWLKKVGKTKTVIKRVWVEEFDEDAFYGLCYELGLSADDVDKFTTANETFALKVI